ncbi:hypothetical protein VTI74DRAFT_6649 [Chaetomium olivicolor]
MPRDPSTTRPSRRSQSHDRRYRRDRERERDHPRERRYRRNSSAPPPPADDDAHAYQQARRKTRRPSSSSRYRDSHYQPASSDGTNGAGGVLSAAALARLNRENATQSGGGHRAEGMERTREQRNREREREVERERRREARRERRREQDRERERERRRERSKGYEVVDVSPAQEVRGYRDAGSEKRRSRRVVSGAVLEEGKGGGGNGWTGLRGGWSGSGGGSSVAREKEGAYEGNRPWYKQRKKLWILIGVCTVLVLIVIIVAAVVVPRAGNGEEKRDDGGGGSSDPKSGLAGISPDSIPKGAPSWLNPFVWADTADFNLTYTNETVGDLPVMGLYSKWDDSAKANEHVPALDEPWGDYSKRPARGVNVGGWLSLEPFITPSLFNYDQRMGIVDEYNLCKYLGYRCESVLEKHYATFVTEDTFKQIRDAGLDHVRIPFSYWAVQTYDGDPYLFRTSWRYLLRAIEWCRRYGLRVNLDVHGLPGSQNGWNHSGRLGTIGWLNGTDGALNAKRSLEIHDRLSKFFSQPRYKNIISHYGLANEPKMTFLPSQAVLQWTEEAYNLVRKNGVSDAVVVFGDGFRGLQNWQGELTNLENAALDVHQYVIFNENQIDFNHSTKVRYACEGWTQQTLQSMNRATGFGPTLVAEWSQADTDCAKHLTNVGWGNRWTGTLITGNASTDITTPRCPTKDRRCSCEEANAPASRWSESYKKFLRMFAEAQMASFERGWGWFYWVWDTEDAPQWSYKKGLEAGVLPAKAYERSFDCDLSQIPSFSDLPEYY